MATETATWGFWAPGALPNTGDNDLAGQEGLGFFAGDFTFHDQGDFVLVDDDENGSVHASSWNGATEDGMRTPDGALHTVNEIRDYRTEFTYDDNNGNYHWANVSTTVVQLENGDLVFLIDNGVASTLPDDFRIEDASGIAMHATDDLSYPSLIASDFEDPPPDPVICFTAGTLIATPAGETPVEKLRTGDPVQTADGKTVPVRWVGRQKLRKSQMGWRMQPVRIDAGVLGDGFPHSDLTVTADHGMVLDNLIINASALVNGYSIRFVPLAELPQEFTVYHVETEAHDVILANGTAAETFIDYIGRKAFDNYQEYFELYGAERIIPEMQRPRISTQRLVPRAICDRLGIAEESFELSESLIA